VTWSQKKTGPGTHIQQPPSNAFVLTKKRLQNNLSEKADLFP
jgi:hypothetical protein